MIILVDYNLNREAVLLSGTLANGNWLELVPIKLVTFAEIGLPIDIEDYMGVGRLFIP